MANFSVADLVPMDLQTFNDIDSTILAIQLEEEAHKQETIARTRAELDKKEQTHNELVAINRRVQGILDDFETEEDGDNQLLISLVQDVPLVEREILDEPTHITRDLIKASIRGRIDNIVMDYNKTAEDRAGVLASLKKWFQTINGISDDISAENQQHELTDEKVFRDEQEMDSSAVQVADLIHGIDSATHRLEYLHSNLLEMLYNHVVDGAAAGSDKSTIRDKVLHDLKSQADQLKDKLKETTRKLAQTKVKLNESEAQNHSLNKMLEAKKHEARRRAKDENIELVQLKNKHDDVVRQLRAQERVASHLQDAIKGYRTRCNVLETRLISLNISTSTGGSTAVASSGPSTNNKPEPVSEASAEVAALNATAESIPGDPAANTSGTSNSMSMSQVAAANKSAAKILVHSEGQPDGDQATLGLLQQQQLSRSRPELLLPESDGGDSDEARQELARTTALEGLPPRPPSPPGTGESDPMKRPEYAGLSKSPSKRMLPQMGVGVLKSKPSRDNLIAELSEQAADKTGNYYKSWKAAAEEAHLLQEKCDKFEIQVRKQAHEYELELETLRVQVRSLEAATKRGRDLLKRRLEEQSKELEQQMFAQVEEEVLIKHTEYQRQMDALRKQLDAKDRDYMERLDNLVKSRDSKDMFERLKKEMANQISDTEARADSVVKQVRDEMTATFKLEMDKLERRHLTELDDARAQTRDEMQEEILQLKKEMVWAATANRKTGLAGRNSKPSRTNSPSRAGSFTLPDPASQPDSRTSSRPGSRSVSRSVSPRDRQPSAKRLIRHHKSMQDLRRPRRATEGASANSSTTSITSILYSSKPKRQRSSDSLTVPLSASLGAPVSSPRIEPRTSTVGTDTSDLDLVAKVQVTQASMPELPLTPKHDGAGDGAGNGNGGANKPIRLWEPQWLLGRNLAAASEEEKERLSSREALSARVAADAAEALEAAQELKQGDFDAPPLPSPPRPELAAPPTPSALVPVLRDASISELPWAAPTPTPLSQAALVTSMHERQVTEYERRVKHLESVGLRLEREKQDLTGMVMTLREDVNDAQRSQLRFEAMLDQKTKEFDAQMQTMRRQLAKAQNEAAESRSAVAQAWVKEPEFLREEADEATQALLDVQQLEISRLRELLAKARDERVKDRLQSRYRRQLDEIGSAIAAFDVLVQQAVQKIRELPGIRAAGRRINHRWKAATTKGGGRPIEILRDDMLIIEQLQKHLCAIFQLDHDAARYAQVITSLRESMSVKSKRQPIPRDDVGFESARSHIDDDVDPEENDLDVAQISAELELEQSQEEPPMTPSTAVARDLRTRLMTLADDDDTFSVASSARSRRRSSGRLAPLRAPQRLEYGEQLLARDAQLREHKVGLTFRHLHEKFQLRKVEKLKQTLPQHLLTKWAKSLNSMEDRHKRAVERFERERSDLTQRRQRNLEAILFEYVGLVDAVMKGRPEPLLGRHKKGKMPASLHGMHVGPDVDPHGLPPRRPGSPNPDGAVSNGSIDGAVDVVMVPNRDPSPPRPRSRESIPSAVYVVESPLGEPESKPPEKKRYFRGASTNLRFHRAMKAQKEAEEAESAE